MFLSRCFTFLMIALLGTACSSTRLHRLTDYRYESQSRKFEMPAYFGEYDQGVFVPVAVIESSPRDVVDEKTREKMLAEVKKEARRIGADAIHKVRFVKEKGTGFVGDPATPFPSIKQGPFEISRLRAEAIKFPDPAKDAEEKEQGM